MFDTNKNAKKKLSISCLIEYEKNSYVCLVKKIDGIKIIANYTIYTSYVYDCECLSINYYNLYRNILYTHAEQKMYKTKIITINRIHFTRKMTSQAFQNSFN